MINKCINCVKWITCKNASEGKNNCEDFNFKRIKYIKLRGEINYEKRKRNKKSN